MSHRLDHAEPVLVTVEPEFYLDHVAMAQFDCGNRIACTEGTRIDVIWQIMRWIAGTGKSTIAFTVAQTLRERGLLGASFFCSRDDAKCSNHKLIFPSIAYQLALLHPSFRQHLTAIVKMRPDIIYADVSYQLQELIVNPLAAMPDVISHPVIVIDALDECKDDSTISVILAAFSRFVQKLPAIKFLVTSRPERNINLGFREQVLQSASHRLILHEVELPVVEADITAYIAPELERIRDHYEIKNGWPSPEQVNSLSKLSFGLFIFAATSIKFIQDQNYDDPEDQLVRILASSRPASGELLKPQQRLDRLYLQVLTNAHPEISAPLAGRLQVVIGTILLLQDPLPLPSIEQILIMGDAKRFQNISVRRTLSRLHSIILVPEPVDEARVVRALHPSLFDFIIDPNRCTNPNFLVDPAKQHTLLLIACLRKMQSLKQNMCQLSDPNALNSEVIDLPTRIAQHMPMELQYACRHWAAHCVHADHSDEVLTLLGSFSSEYLLFWIEACSLLGDLRNQLVHLEAVQRTWVKPEEQELITIICLNDCTRFIREFFPVISISCGHVYESALVFAPHESILRKLYSLQSSKLKVINGPRNWSSSSLIIEGHSNAVSSVQISPDGSRILSGSFDCTIRLWDILNGAVLNKIEGHPNAVALAAFLPDSTRIISTSHEDYSIRVWDAVNGAPLKTLQLPFGSKASVTFSPDGQRVLYGPVFGLFKIWNSSTEEVLDVIQRKLSFSGACATFSADGNRIISVEDRVIQLWDAVSGAHLATTPVAVAGHTPLEYFDFSPDRTRLLARYGCPSDGQPELLNSGDGAHLMSFKVHANFYVVSIAFAPDGATIAMGLGDGSIQLWDIESGAPLLRLEGHTEVVAQVAFSPDGRYVVSGGFDTTIRLWNIAHTIRSARTFPVAPFSTLDLLPCNDTPRILSGEYDGGPIPMHLDGHPARIWSMVFSTDAAILATTYLEGPPILWDAVSGLHLHTLKGHSKKVSAVAFSPDGPGATILSTSSDGTVRLWDTANGNIKQILQVEGLQADVISAIFSPAGNLIAAGSSDSKISIWNALDGMHLLTIDVGHGPVFEIAFSTDSSLISAIFPRRADRVLRLWDVTSGVQLKALNFAYEFSHEFACTPDGAHIILGDRSGLDAFSISDLAPENKPRSAFFLAGSQWQTGFPVNWISHFPDHQDLIHGNEARLWAEPCGKSLSNDLPTFKKLTYLWPGYDTKHIYFMQDGWIWLVQPRQRLCWVPVTSRRFPNTWMGPVEFISSRTRIALSTRDRGVMIIDFSDMIKAEK
ncbi:hypothetical protein HWV62_33747 [Athelia sp. TMB]|nr:hypothetical protein HWV62_33747 [Athelia sp. TMB]